MLPPRKPSKGVMRSREGSGPLRSEAHLQFIRGHACIVPGCPARFIRACHVRYGLPADEPQSEHGGTGKRPGDHWTYPACDEHHRQEHQGVQSFQRKYGLDLAKAAQEYAAASPALRRLKAKQERESRKDMGA